MTLTHIAAPRHRRPAAGGLGRRIAILLGAVAAVLVASPAAVSAHPLGNFTINRYDGLTLSVDSAVLDHVLDMAEIPAFQERQRMDADGDTVVSDVEAAGWAEDRCVATATELDLRVAGVGAPLRPVSVGISFPPGQGGLLTLRLVCTYAAAFAPVTDAAEVSFRDDTFPDRLGWREIVAAGDGVTLRDAGAYAAGSSARLTAYPEAELGRPRDQRSADFTIVPGGASAPAAAVPDAVPLGSPAEQIVGAVGPAAAVPGGVTDLPAEIAAVIQARDLTPAAIVASLLVAVVVGAFHAASPGHGKTLMAAYLVGTRGTVRHALGLGLTVTVSHTIGVLALGGLILVAGSVLPAERLFPILGLVSGAIVTIIGLGLLAQRVRESRERDRIHALTHDGSDGHSDHAAHTHGEPHTHDGSHSHQQPDSHHAAQTRGEPHTHDGSPPDAASHAHHDADDVHPHPHEDEVGGWHSHGLVRHTHLPRGDDPLRWRNLVALGLVGGLVPSASAILILVGSIAAGRPAYGMLLTLAFGLGMAVVLVGVGVLLVHARGLIERWPRGDRLAPLLARAPLVTAVAFVVLGAMITVQAGLQIR